MGNRNHRALLLVENQMADLAEAEVALQGLWARVHSLCYKPAVGMEDIDQISQDLKAIEAGLAAGRRLLQVEREAIP